MTSRAERQRRKAAVRNRTPTEAERLRDAEAFERAILKPEYYDVLTTEDALEDALAGEPEQPPEPSSDGTLAGQGKRDN